jgi:hypothetical protein
MANSNDLALEGAKIVAVLSKEGDRGCVLVTAAMLEDAIEKHIKARLIAPCEKRDELIANSNNAPISNFAAKINLGYRLGLFTQSERDIYHQLRHLRNDCAHSVDEQTFASNSFKNRIENIIAKSENVWEKMKLQFGPLISKDNPPQTIKEFIALAGWRRAFMIFFSLVIAHKVVYLNRVTAVATLYAKA